MNIWSELCHFLSCWKRTENYISFANIDTIIAQNPKLQAEASPFLTQWRKSTVFHQCASEQDSEEGIHL